MSAFKRLTFQASLIENVAETTDVHEARRTAIIVRNRIRRWHRLGRLNEGERELLITHVEAQEAALREMEMG